MVAAAVKASWNSSDEPRKTSIAPAMKELSFQKSSILRKGVVQVSTTVVDKRFGISAGIDFTSANKASRKTPISRCFLELHLHYLHIVDSVYHGAKCIVPASMYGSNASLCVEDPGKIIAIWKIPLYFFMYTIK